jgi:hypothetical protein
MSCGAMHIPVYEVSLPEYTLPKPAHLSGKIFTTSWGIVIPAEYEEEKPDFGPIAERIIGSLRKHFSGRRIALRMIGSMEHQGKSADDLIAIIKQLGHDRYDPHRKGDRYENIGNKKIDLFALELTVGKEDEEIDIKYALESFYYYPIADRNSPVRVDIAIVYDLEQLEVVEHQYEGRADIKRDGYVFKHEDRPGAVLAMLKLL